MTSSASSVRPSLRLATHTVCICYILSFIEISLKVIAKSTHEKSKKNKTKITHHTLSGIIIQVCRPQKELKDAVASWKWKPVWHWTGKSFVSSEHQCHFHYIVFIYRIHCFASFEICFLWYATKRWRSHYLNACEYCEFCSREWIEFHFHWHKVRMSQVYNYEFAYI